MEYQNDIPSVRLFFDFRWKDFCQVRRGNISHLVFFVDHNRHVMRKTRRHGGYQEHQQNAQAVILHQSDHSQLVVN
jgi:hypothetical protein